MANVLTRRDPWGSLFDEFFTDFFSRGAPALRSAELPAAVRARMDVIDKNDRFEVLVDLPGVKKEDIRVAIEGNQVFIEAELKKEKEEKKGEKVVRSERYYGKQSRSFTLGHDIDAGKAEAKYNDGVLELKLPKKANGSSKELKVQ